MAKVQLSIEELIGLVRGEVPMKDARINIANALLEAWTSHPDLQERIDEIAEGLIKDKVNKLVNNAFNENLPTIWNSNKRSFSGWAGTIVEHHFNEAMKNAGVGGKDIQSMLWEMISQRGKEMSTAYAKTLEDAKPFIDEQVRTLVPQYVTDEYKERVAKVFDAKKVEAMLSDMVQKAIGGMLMSGALRFNPPSET